MTEQKTQYHSQTFNFCKVYKIELSPLWAILNNKDNINQLFSNLQFPSFLSISHFFSLNPKVIIDYTKTTSYFKEIKYVYTFPTSTVPVVLIIYLSIKSNTLEASSLLTASIEFSNIQILSDLPETKNIIQILETFATSLFSSISSLIKWSPKLFNNYQSITIHANKQLVWDFMTSWKFIDYVENTNISNLQIENNLSSDTVGAKISFWFNKKSRNELVVAEVFQEDKIKEWYYTYNWDSINGISQIVKLRFIDVNDNFTFLSIEHTFSIKISTEMDQCWNIQKMELLKGVKQCWEEKYKQVIKSNQKENESANANANANEKRNYGHCDICEVINTNNTCIDMKDSIKGSTV